jgi:hypothetical protein
MTVVASFMYRDGRRAEGCSFHRGRTNARAPGLGSDRAATIRPNWATAKAGCGVSLF